jgi:hypothetical protein
MQRNAAHALRTKEIHCYRVDTASSTKERVCERTGTETLFAVRLVVALKELSSRKA